MLSTLAMQTALGYSAHYYRNLNIRPSEYWPYMKKSAKLAVCYAGFAQDLSRDQAKGAGKAGFLSSAYDVASDWGKGDQGIRTFEQIVRAEVSPELGEIGIAMLHKDINGELSDDGLERGSTSFRLVLEAMGLRERFEQMTDINTIGLLLQIVDDVRDYKEDIQTGDQNCLTSTNRDRYLEMLVTGLNDNILQELFPYGRLLKKVIRQSREHARMMLAENQNQIYRI